MMDQFLEVCLNVGGRSLETEQHPGVVSGSDVKQEIKEEVDPFIDIEGSIKIEEPEFTVERNDPKGLRMRIVKNKIVGGDKLCGDVAEVNKSSGENVEKSNLDDNVGDSEKIDTNAVKKRKMPKRKSKCAVAETSYLNETPAKRIVYTKLVGYKRGPRYKKMPVKRYPCKYCTYFSTKQSNLTRHILIVHKTNTDKYMKNLEKNNFVDIFEDENTKNDLDQMIEDEFNKTLAEAQEQLTNEISEEIMQGKLAHSIFIENDKVEHSTIVKGQKRGPKMKHNYEKLFPCTFCTYSSTRRFDLKRHISTVHNKERPFVCSQCSFSSGLAETLKQHIIKMHNDSKYRCDKCDFACAKKPDYLRHMKTMHNSGFYKCDLCDNFTCLWPIELINHKRRAHRVTIST